MDHDIVHINLMMYLISIFVQYDVLIFTSAFPSPGSTCLTLSGLRLKLVLWCILINKGKGTAVPLQARSGPEGSRKLRFPDFMTTAQDGGKVVSLTHRPPLPPGNTPGTHFC